MSRQSTLEYFKALSWVIKQKSKFDLDHYSTVTMEQKLRIIDIFISLYYNNDKIYVVLFFKNIMLRKEKYTINLYIEKYSSYRRKILVMEAVHLTDWTTNASSLEGNCQKEHPLGYLSVILNDNSSSQTCTTNQKKFTGNFLETHSSLILPFWERGGLCVLIAFN